MFCDIGRPDETGFFWHNIDCRPTQGSLFSKRLRADSPENVCGVSGAVKSVPGPKYVYWKKRDLSERAVQ